MKKKALKNKEQKEKRQNLIFGIINVGIILTVTITIIAVIVVSLKKSQKNQKRLKDLKI